MKVILQKDIKGRGRRGDIVEVSDGFGRNYLISRGLATFATAGEIEKLKGQQKSRVHAVASEQAAALGITKKLKKLQFDVVAKTNPSGHLYAGLKESEILANMKKSFPNLPQAARIVDYSPIKTVGETQWELDLGFGTTANFKLKVISSDQTNG